MLKLAVVRPEPGNAATAARAAARGHDVLRLPFFAIRPLAWTPPPPGTHDALILTSANAIRHGGRELDSLRGLPVVAVGAASAAAASAAGFRVVATGTTDAAAAAALAKRQGFVRPLHLTGREHVAIPDTPALAVYASEPLPISDEAIVALSGRTVLLHSPRAAARLAALVPNARRATAVAALSPPVAAAAGDGWRHVAVAARPTDAALLDALGPAGN